MNRHILAFIGLSQAIAVNKRHALSNQDFLFSLMQEDPKPAPAPAAPAAAAPAAKAAGNATGNASNSAGGAPPGYAYPYPYPNYGYGYGYGHPYMNWWEVADKHETANLKDDTPAEIKSHPAYKKIVQRFLKGNFKDKNLETMKQTFAKNTIDQDEIDEEKEREGMYPNELDDEMHGYVYGDKIIPHWNGWSNGWYNDYWNHQGTLAPPFDPNSHFESPYYDYGNRYYYGHYYSSLPADAKGKPGAVLSQNNTNATAQAQV